MIIKVVLADDHKMIRSALCSLLENESDIAVVGEAGDGEALLELVARTEPVIAVVDVGMPGMNGIEATKRLLAERPDMKVIALTAYSDKRVALEMLDAGAKGYLIKATAGDELPRAIRSVAQGQTYLCPEIAGTLAETARGKTSLRGNIAAKLGQRELEVLALLTEGKGSAAIAVQMQIAGSTVEVHRRNIMRKLDLHNVAELTKYAIREGLTSV